MIMLSFSAGGKSESVTFEKIYYCYRDMLYACALGIVKNPADADKIKSFVTLMTETAWRSSDSEISADELNAYFSFAFYGADGKISAQLDMCRNIFSQGAAVIIYNGDKSTVFRISNKIYDELLCFINKRHYLHDSTNEMPSEKLCRAAAEVFFADMTKSEN